MCRSILPTGAALMYTLDEMCVLSMRMFFNSLTYQANKLLEKVIALVCFAIAVVLLLHFSYLCIVEFFLL